MEKEKRNLENAYSLCDHIWIISNVEYDSYEGRRYEECGCIKCGLDERYKHYYSNIRELMNDDNNWYKEMFIALNRNSSRKGIRTNIECDLDLAKAIYSKIKQSNPGIDDETAIKYFKVALDNMRNTEVTDVRKTNRVKRLALHPKFNSWSSNDIFHRF